MLWTNPSAPLASRTSEKAPSARSTVTRRTPWAAGGGGGLTPAAATPRKPADAYSTPTSRTLVADEVSQLASSVSLPRLESKLVREKRFHYPTLKQVGCDLYCVYSASGRGIKIAKIPLEFTDEWAADLAEKP